MATVTIEEAHAHLPELIGKLQAGQSLLITDHDKPVAQITGLASQPPQPMPGRCKGKLIIVADDDEHLQDWAEYMP